MNFPIDNYQYDDAIELEDRTTAEWKGQIQDIHILLQIYNCSPDLPETSAIPSIGALLKFSIFYARCCFIPSNLRDVALIRNKVLWIELSELTR